MKAVMVQYTVKPEYSDQNKANIRRVMEAIRANPIPGMRYASFTLDDGLTFVHINMGKDAETLSKIGEVKEFGEFQAALGASGPTSPPKAENLELVNAGFEI